MNINLTFYEMVQGARWPKNLKLLVRTEGMPMWLGETLVSPHHVCWWFPYNWFSVVAAVSWAVLRHPVELVRHMRHANDQTKGASHE